MDSIKYIVYEGKDISNSVADIAVKLLKKQEKVVDPTRAKVQACKIVVIGYQGEVPIALGTIKKKTVSDFGPGKSNLPLLEKEFEWELGYFYTDENFRGLGMAPTIAKLLMKKMENINLMASTELFPKNGMLKILSANGFIQVGNSWKSVIHDGLLGLFIRVKEGEMKKKNKISVLPR